MDLEEMKKPELVKHARTLEQQVKLLEAEMKELKDSTTSKVESEQVETNNEEVVLPYKAFSMIVDSGKSARVIPLTFDLKGNAKVHMDKVKTFNAPYKAAHELNKLNIVEVEKQSVKKVEEKQ